MEFDDPDVVAACQAGDFETAASLINAAAVPAKKPTEDSLYTWLGLQDVFGVDRVTGWRVAIRLASKAAEDANDLATAEALTMFRETMASQGYAFADDRTQARLDALHSAGILSETDRDALSALGFLPLVPVSADTVRYQWTTANRESFDTWFNAYVAPVMHDKAAAKAAIAANIGEW